jgi:hypothetical protein
VRAASAGGVNCESIHDECNAARRKKTRFHGAFMGWDWYNRLVQAQIIGICACRRLTTPVAATR